MNNFFSILSSVSAFIALGATSISIFTTIKTLYKIKKEKEERHSSIQDSNFYKAKREQLASETLLKEQKEINEHIKMLNKYVKEVEELEDKNRKIINQFLVNSSSKVDVSMLNDIENNYNCSSLNIDEIQKILDVIEKYGNSKERTDIDMLDSQIKTNLNSIKIENNSSFYS